MPHRKIGASVGGNAEPDPKPGVQPPIKQMWRVKQEATYIEAKAGTARSVSDCSSRSWQDPSMA